MSDRERFERIHEAGVERHKDAWYLANRVAVNAARGEIDVERHKAVLSLIVLRVLDAVLLGQEAS